MSLSICIQCGYFKGGAWTACPKCGFQPTEIDDMAKSMMLSSHFLSEERMIDFSTRRRSGEPWNFSDEAVEPFRKRLMEIFPRDKDGRVVPPKEPPSV